MYRPVLTNYKRQRYHCDWFTLPLYSTLLESSHIYQIGKNKTYYNLTIEHIADSIIKHQNYYNVQLYANNNDIYECYEFINPFNNSPSLNVISKLKIYVQCINNPDNENIYVLSSDLSPELKSEYNTKVLPLYKSIGTTILVISIIMDLYKPNKNFLISSLHHEIRHTLDYIADKKLTGLSNKLNYSVDILNNIIEDDNIPNLIKTTYTFIRDCMYYTQDTEIKAHLENAYYELEVSGLSREKALELCKILTYAYSKPFCKINELLEILPTTDNYIRLLSVLRRRMNDSDNMIFNKNISKLILDIVYYNSPQERLYKVSVKDLLEKWERLLMKFIKQFTKAVYKHYELI